MMVNNSVFTHKHAISLSAVVHIAWEVVFSEEHFLPWANTMLVQLCCWLTGAIISVQGYAVTPGFSRSAVCSSKVFAMESAAHDRCSIHLSSVLSMTVVIKCFLVI